MMVSKKRKGIDTMKRKPSPLAKKLLNAVWNKEVEKAREAILEGADPNWIINGYPVLFHAVYMRDVDMVMMLIDNGAILIGEALGFALDRGHWGIGHSAHDAPGRRRRSKNRRRFMDLIQIAMPLWMHLMYSGRKELYESLCIVFTDVAFIKGQRHDEPTGARR